MRKIFKKLTTHKNIKYLLIFNVFILFIVKVSLPFAGSQIAAIIQMAPFSSREIIEETNRVRINNNLARLQPNSKLDLAASEKLKDMADKEYFAHNSPQGVSPWHWIDKSGYNYTYAGENLALGFFNAPSTVSAWMNSPTHRTNIINTNYSEIGVATGKVTINGATNILVVQMFGQSNDQQILAATPAPAQTFVTKTEAPAPLPSNTNNNVAGLETQNVSTDAGIPSVIAPSETTQSLNWPFKADLVYQIYIAITLLVFALAIITNGLSGRVILATALNLLLFFISVLIPASTINVSSVIF